MSVNLVVLDGVVKSMALRFDAEAKPELRFTLQQTDHATDGKPWVSYWPCCASGAAATRLAEALEDGQHILVTSGKLCYRKREGKMGLQSRMEILVWMVERLAESSPDERTDVGEGDSTSEQEIVAHRGEEPVSHPKVRKRALPKHLQQEWTGKVSALHSNQN